MNIIEFIKSAICRCKHFWVISDKCLKDKEYYLVCQSGGREVLWLNSLRQKGFNVINVAGGVGSYLGKHRS